MTLRAVYGLNTAQIAAALLLPAPILTKRLVCARRKIRDTGIRLTLPSAQALPDRLDVVLRVIYLVFTEATAPAPARRWSAMSCATPRSLSPARCRRCCRPRRR